ncbi:hypothetical protein FG152_22205 [Ochrobactrum sp. XJ1]|nr:hypothetical protein [Ochrobactrum sp. XJ1]
MASEDLLKKAVAAFNALSPEQQAEMMDEQRQSWVRGNIGLSRDERGMTSPAMREVENRLTPLIKAVNSWADRTATPVAPVSPDATGKCGELVTVETQFRMTDRTDRPWGNGPIPEYLNGYAVSRELVTRSQAVELLAAERAENTRLQSENDAQADQISELQMTPWPEWATKVLAVIRKRSGYDGYGDAIEGVDLPAELDECIAAIEADNAALTARVKELEEHCELLCDPTIIRLEKENSDLEAKLAAAGKIGQEVLSLIAGDAGIPDHIRDKARAVLGGKPS